MVAPGVVGRGGVGEVEVPIFSSAFDVVVARVEDANRYLDEDEGGLALSRKKEKESINCRILRSMMANHIA